MSGRTVGRSRPFSGAGARVGTVVTVAAVAVVGTGLPAQAATPATPTSGLAASQLASQQPVLSAVVSDPDGGQVTAKFFARSAGSTTWDLADGSAAAQKVVTSGGTASLRLPNRARIGSVIQWQVQSCDATACSPSSALQSATISPALGAGARPGATRLSFSVTDQAVARVDVGTGNLMLATNALRLPGVTSDVDLGRVYNSLSVAAGVNPDGLGYGWAMAPGGGTSLVEASDKSVTYTAPSGLTGLFTLKAGSTTAYDAPAGVKADLVRTTGGWTLSDHDTSSVQAFDTTGRVTSISDRNGNATTFTYRYGNVPETVTSSAGPRRTAQLISNGSDTNLTQVIDGSTNTSRQVKYTLDANGDLTAITDAAARTTRFSYTGHDLTTVTSPSGATTTFGYDAQHRVTSITQANTAAGSPGTSTTRLSYTAGTTLLAGPNTDQTLAVTAVPRTTYTVDVTGRVTAVTDAAGRTRAKTYTANFDTATATTGTGSTAGTTTNTYGANSGESLTKSQSPTGAAVQLAYNNTAAATKYQPSGSTDPAGNTSTYTYNGAGNQLTSADATAAKATVTYNTDGTVASATAPGNGTTATTYGYNTDHQLTSITPVAGSSLGARAVTYDLFGRTRTTTNGRGVTTTYAYDSLDRVTSVTTSGGTVATTKVTFTYDSAGRVATRADATGTTTYGYDDLGRLTTRSSTAGGGTITYGYDKASNLVSVTDSRGTTTYEFDDAAVPTGMRYDYLGAVNYLQFGVDDQGRRTDAWLQSRENHTKWMAHSHTDYDTSGRVSRVTADQGTGDASYTRVVDLRYCYTAGTTAPTCTTTASTDRTKLAWAQDALTGDTTTYTYDTLGRLTKAATTGATPATYSYSYDANGNRITAAVTGTTTKTDTYNKANQLTTAGFGYDGAGNLTSSGDLTGITYNGYDQMTAVTKAGVTYNYKYAGTNQNELTHGDVPNYGAYDYTYGRTDRQGLPIIESLKVTSGTSVNTAYIEHDPVTGAPLLLRTPSGMQSMYIYDGTGNPIMLITSAAVIATAYKFDPYGAAAVTVDNNGNGVKYNPYTFKGGLQDRTTGWVKYGQRWYDPTTGRFTQQDTLDTPLDPGNANRYAYAGGDPINNLDPIGYSFLSTALEVLGDGGACFAGGRAVGGVGATVGLAAGPEGAAAGGLLGATYGCAAAIIAANTTGNFISNGLG